MNLNQKLASHPIYSFKNAINCQEKGYISMLDDLREVKREIEQSIMTEMDGSSVLGNTLDPIFTKSELADPRNLYIIIQLDEGQVFHMRDINNLINPAHPSSVEKFMSTSTDKFGDSKIKEIRN